jgi:hypothetical protein
MVLLEGLVKLEKKKSSPGLEPATFWLVAQPQSFTLQRSLFSNISFTYYPIIRHNMSII